MSDTVIKLVEQLEERVAALEAEIAKYRAPVQHYHYHTGTPTEPCVSQFEYYRPRRGDYTGDPPPGWSGNTW